MLSKRELSEKIVSENIKCCVTSWVIQSLNTEMFDYCDIRNVYINNSDEIRDIEDKIKELQEEKEGLENDVEELMDGSDWDDLDIEIQEKLDPLEFKITVLEDTVEDLESQLEDLESEGGTRQEVYEWWIVSEWLKHKLLERGEVILDNEYVTAWGRQTSGQAIKMDSVIEDIADYLISRFRKLR